MNLVSCPPKMSIDWKISAIINTHTRTHETITVKSNSCENVRLDVPMEKAGRDYSKQDFIVSNHSCLRINRCQLFLQCHLRKFCKIEWRLAMFEKYFFHEFITSPFFFSTSVVTSLNLTINYSPSSYHLYKYINSDP